MFVTAILAAGGRGQRFGGAVPKQLIAVGGRSLLERSVALLLAHAEIDEIVVALPADLVDSPPPYLVNTSKPVRIVAGGARRQDSVLNSFRAADPRSDVIVVHDAARPFASPALVSRTIAAAVESGAAVAAVGASDTVKRAEAQSDRRGPASGHDVRHVLETLPREVIFLAQTPQAFRRSVLGDALALAETGVEGTDEASLVERAGHAVRIVAGEPGNIKVTTPDDLVVAEVLAGLSPRAGHARAGIRVGTGYDLHRLVGGRPLMVAGIRVEAERGALGHSDADVACHAVTDAILGAASLGDIGRHFPDTDPRWKDVSGLELLSRTAAIVRDQGFAIENVDVTVILERPKIKDHIDAMRQAMAHALGIAADSVSVKGKTNEGMDATGRGEAIAAHAVALVRLDPSISNQQSAI